MNGPGVLAGARHVLAVERAQRAVLAAARDRGDRLAWVLPVLVRWSLWAPLPAFALFAAANAVAGGDRAHVWRVACAAAILLGVGYGFQESALSFAARRVLFLPGKDSELAARLLRQVPRLLVVGVAWACAVWWVLRPLSIDASLCAACAGTAALAPGAWTIGQLLARLRAGVARPTLAPLALVAGAISWWVWPAAWWGAGAAYWIGAGITTAVGAAALVRLLWTWARPRAAAATLATELVRAPHIAIVVLVCLPGVELAWATAALGAAMVVLSPFVLTRLFASVRTAPAHTGGTGFEPLQWPAWRGARAVAPAAPAAPPVSFRHRGRSSWRAAWRLHWLERVQRWRELGPTASALRLLALAVWSGGLTFFLVRIQAKADASHAGTVGIVVASALIALFAPNVAPPLSQRLHAWGVDWARQARVQIAGLLCGTALPVLAWFAAAASLVGWGASHSWLCASMAATFLLRGGWRGFARAGELATPARALLLGVVAVLALWLAGPRAAWWIATGAGLLGVVGIALRLRRAREPALAGAIAAARAQGRDLGATPPPQPR